MPADACPPRGTLGRAEQQTPFQQHAENGGWIGLEEPSGRHHEPSSNANENPKTPSGPPRQRQRTRLPNKRRAPTGQASGPPPTPNLWPRRCETAHKPLRDRSPPTNSCVPCSDNFPLPGPRRSPSLRAGLRRRTFGPPSTVHHGEPLLPRRGRHHGGGHFPGPIVSWIASVSLEALKKDGSRQVAAMLRQGGRFDPTKLRTCGRRLRSPDCCLSKIHSKLGRAERLMTQLFRLLFPATTLVLLRLSLSPRLVSVVITWKRGSAPSLHQEGRIRHQRPRNLCNKLWDVYNHTHDLMQQATQKRSDLTRTSSGHGSRKPGWQGDPSHPLFDWDADLTRPALQHHLRITFLDQDTQCLLHGQVVNHFAVCPCAMVTSDTCDGSRLLR